MAESNLTLKQGVTQTIEIANIKDANGVDLNPAGCSVRGQVRQTVDTPTVLHEWTSQGGSPNATLSTGKVTLDVPAAVSAAWTWKTGRYDIELTDSTGKVARIAEGIITISREVTR